MGGFKKIEILYIYNRGSNFAVAQVRAIVLGQIWLWLYMKRQS